MICHRVLRSACAALLVCNVAAAATAAELPGFSFGGDARLRYEDIDVDPGSDVSRERYRARLAIDAGRSDFLAVHVRFATGTGDPVSTNLNFGESFTADDLQLDRAYLDWRVNDGMRLYAGKMKNPLYRPGGTSLNWDSDWNPEGIAASFGRADDETQERASLAVFDLADQGDDHSRLFAVQAGRTWRLSRETEFSTGAGYYDYTNTRGGKPFYRGLPAGNTVDAAGNFVYDYDIVEVWLEYSFGVFGVPVGIFADWARNLEADREDRAYSIGVNAGKADERGDLAVSWAWHDTEADAVIGLFTDSDLAGGNTDSRGHMFSVEYGLTDRLFAGGTLILSEFGHFAARPRDYDRVMLDVEFRF